MAVANSGASITNTGAAGGGTAITFTSVCSQHGLQVVVTGYVGSGTVVVGVDVSMDNTNWTTLQGTIAITGNGTYYWTNPYPAPALYARANIQKVPPTVTGLTVNATLASE